MVKKLPKEKTLLFAFFHVVKQLVLRDDFISESNTHALIYHYVIEELQQKWQCFHGTESMI